MKIIVTDDEPRALKDTLDAINEVIDDCQAACFSTASDAIEYAAVNQVDVAFLDIELGRTSGIVLAKKLKDIQPDIHIIFVTSYDKYAVDAFAIHATGYLLKPVYPQDIKREMTFLYGDIANCIKQNIRVRTFGGFDVYVNEEKLHFKRSKSKELLAYLVDRRGHSVTVREACNVLFEDGKYDVSRKNYFQTIVSELQKHT